MRRGLHVLQEHPVHPEEMSESLRLSRAHGVIYRLNSFYVHIGPVRRFIGAVKELQRSHKPLFIDAACGCQLSYSLLDVLSQSLGSLRPWNLEVMPHRKGEIFTTIKAIFCGVPATLRIQNQLDPADPDGFSHLLHRIDFGYAPGTLSLAETHGPLIWAPRPQFPHEVRAPDAKPQFSYPVIEKPRVTLIGPVDQPSFEEIFRDVWPQGVTRALLEFRRAIMGHENSLHIAQQQLTVSQLWKEMLEKIGPPELVHGDSVANLPKERLAAMDRSAREMERMP
jgi:thiazolinyl imide reductase